MPLPITPLLFKCAPTLANYATGMGLQHLPQSALVKWLRDHSPNFIQRGVEKLIAQKPIEKALRAVCDRPSMPSNTVDALRNWIQDEDFQALLAALQNGENPPAEDSFEAVVSTFVPYLEILDALRAQEIARAVLTEFLKQLDKFVIFEDNGLAIHDRREQARDLAINDRLEGIELHVSNLSQRLLPPETKEFLPEHEVQYKARLDEVRRLLEKGKIKAARVILENLRSDLSCQSASNLILYRVEANLGICALFLDGSTEIAAAHFEAARRYQPEHPTGFANCARIALLRDDPEQALFLANEALLRDPMHSFARAMQVQALHALAKAEELRISFEAEGVCSNPVTLLAFAQNAFQAEDYLRSREFTLRVVELDPKDPYAWELLGRTIAVPVQRRLNTERPLPWMIAPGDLAILEEARTAFGRAIALLKETDWTDALAVAYANRASISALRGEFNEALLDCEEALRFDPSLELTYATKAAVLLQMSRYKEARTAYEELLTKFEVAPRHQLALAVCYLNTQNSIKAVALLESLKAQPDAQASRMPIYELLLEAYVASNKRELAQELIEEHRLQGAERECITLENRFHQVTGNFAPAVNGFRQIRESVQGNERQRITLELAETLYKAHSFHEAADEFATITNDLVANSTRTKYYVSLFNGGRYKEALEKAKAAREREGPQPVITLIEARILDLIGDIEESTSLYRQLVSITDRDPEVLIWFTMALNRRCRFSEATEVIQKVDLADPRLEAFSSMMVAKLRHHLGLDNVLAFALHALQLGRDQPQIQLDYLWMILSREHIDKALLEPELADTGTVISLESTRSKREVILVDDQSIQDPPKVIRLSSLLGQALRGKRAGDIVYWGSPTAEYRVATIQSVYVREHQRIYQDFGMLFPESDSLRMITVDGEPSVSLRHELKQRSESVEKLLGTYRRGHIPASRLAQALGETLFDTLLSLAAAAEEKLLVSDNQSNEYLQSFSLLGQHRQILMEGTSLFTMAYLDLLGILPGHFEQIIVAQQVLDDVLEAIQKAESGPVRFAYASCTGDGVTVNGATTFDARGREILRKLESFLLACCTVLPVPMVLDFEPGLYFRYCDAFTAGAVGSQLLAHHLRIPIWVDDFNWRRSWLQQGIASVWTQPVLQYLFIGARNFNGRSILRSRGGVSRGGVLTDDARFFPVPMASPTARLPNHQAHIRYAAAIECKALHASGSIGVCL